MTRTLFHINFFILALLAAGCATRYTIRSYPEGANVYVKNVITQEKKLVGRTPLVLKKTKQLGEVFFLDLEKDNFFPKQILMTPHDGENLTISVDMDPLQSQKALADNAGNRQPAQQQKPTKEQVKNLAMRLAILENTVSMYKDALFSGRYSAAPPRWQRDTDDSVVDHLFKAQQFVMVKKYPQAQDELDKALAIDRYLPQAYLIRGSIFYVNKQFEQAKIAWERALRIDPYNAQAYQYLRLVNKKLGMPVPPNRPSYLRAPATAPLSRSLNH